MTRKDKLIAMNGALLIEVADKLGVKVRCNKSRNQLKEAKALVIERILAAESVQNEPVEEVKEEIEETSTNEVEQSEDDFSASEEVEEEIKEVKKETKKSKGKMIEFNGKSQSLNAWAKELGFAGQTLYARLYIQNWDVEKAFTTPPRKK